MKKLIACVVLSYFTLWLAEMPEARADGRSLFKSGGCGSCHDPVKDQLSTGRGPSLNVISDAYKTAATRTRSSATGALLKFFAGKSRPIVAPKKFRIMSRRLNYVKRLSFSQRRELAAFVLSHGSGAASTSSAPGGGVFKQRGCTKCHDPAKDQLTSGGGPSLNVISDAYRAAATRRASAESVLLKFLARRGRAIVAPKKYRIMSRQLGRISKLPYRRRRDIAQYILSFGSAASASPGAAVFENGRCSRCHDPTKNQMSSRRGPSLTMVANAYVAAEKGSGGSAASALLKFFAGASKAIVAPMRFRQMSPQLRTIKRLSLPERQDLADYILSFATAAASKVVTPTPTPTEPTATDGLRYLPRTAAIVAYANLNDLRSSPLWKVLEPLRSELQGIPALYQKTQAVWMSIGQNIEDPQSLVMVLDGLPRADVDAAAKADGTRIRGVNGFTAYERTDAKAFVWWVKSDFAVVTYFAKDTALLQQIRSDSKGIWGNQKMSEVLRQFDRGSTMWVSALVRSEWGLTGLLGLSAAPTSSYATLNTKRGAAIKVSASFADSKTAAGAYVTIRDQIEQMKKQPELSPYVAKARSSNWRERVTVTQTLDKAATQRVVDHTLSQ